MARSIAFADAADQQEPRRDLAASLRALRQARSLVVTDAEILGGNPVFRGTRVPVHLIAAMLEQGSTEADILKAYPRITLAEGCPWRAGHDYPDRVGLLPPESRSRERDVAD